MRARVALLVALGCMQLACSFAPSYRVPESPAPPPQFKEVQDWKPAAPADAASRGDWWEAFGDAGLNTIEVQVAAANQDLKAGYSRLMQARAATRVARASLLPTISAGASASRARSSINAPRFPRGTEPTGNDFVVDADLSYEIDLWGRVRNSVAAARANQQASAADLAGLGLSIQAEAATTYFMLRANDAQQALLDQTVEDYTKALKLTEDLYRGGGAALTDVAQARAQLETARTQAADIRLQRAQAEHALAVLTGQLASSFRLEPDPLPLNVAPPGYDTGLPSALLERRPDVAAAERRVSAANAQIGVARAAYFPVFSLAAVAGYESTRASNWIDAPSRMWSVGPSALLTVFDFGRHRAQAAQAKAAYDEQVADYRQTVLAAFQEVEDQLAALRQLDQESVTQAAAVVATGEALKQAQFRYKAGLVTYLEVSISENTALQAQLATVSIQQRRFGAAVLLVKALGGGWREQNAAPEVAVRGE